MRTGRGRGRGTGDRGPRQRAALRFGLLGVVLWAIAAVAGGAEWRRVTAPLALSFPRDHGAHLELRTEWWYVTATLTDGHGGRLGVQITFFRRGIDPERPVPAPTGLDARQVLAAHLAIAEPARDRLVFAERSRRVAAGLAGFAEDELAVWVEDWRLERRGDGTLWASAADAESGVAIALAMTPAGDPVLHGDDGVSAKGPEPGNASAYVSWPRMRTAGTVTIAGRELTVAGEAWLDHEWGTSQLGAGVVGWDWLGLRLADGRSLMAFRLRHADGSTDPASAGSLIAADGTVTRLGAADLRFEVLGTWTSDRTRAAYPVRLRVRVPGAGLDLELTPWVAGAEIDARASTGIVYWEGPVTVSGTAAGNGYLELTGYAASLAGRL